MRIKATAPFVGVVLAVCMAAGWSPAQSKAPEVHDETAARLFLNSLGERAIAVAQDTSSSLPERERRLRLLIREGFDVNVIARFVLARHWRRMPNEQRREFVVAFEDVLVAQTLFHFQDYEGETFDIGEAGPDPTNPRLLSVSTTVHRPNGTKARVNWRLLKKDDDYRVIDVVLEGVSIALTLRSEFGAVIQQSGGVQGLINLLKEKKEEKKRNTV